MKWSIRVALGLVLAGTLEASATDKPIRFWNLTAETISEFYLTPTGTSQWGANQCSNDNDGTVETDEVLTVIGFAPDRYDAKFEDTSGRTGVVKKIDVNAYSIFSSSKKKLQRCKG